MGRYEKNLFSFDYPEFKGDTCKTGWTYVPCPTWSNPTRTCRQDIKTPCIKRRTSRFRVYAYVTYPDSVEDYVKKEIEHCNLIAAGAATTVITLAVSSSAAATPAAQISAAAAAIPAAVEAYSKSFWSCITSFSISSSIGRQIKYDIVKQTYKLNDWH